MNKNLKNSSSKTTFARDLGLFDATMIGVGAMIGAGIFVLTGIASGEAGPASIMAFALNGVVTLLTAFAYAELASAIPRAGGGYSFVRMAFPGATGFVAGWMLWFAYTVACGLYALGFAGYFWEFLEKYAERFTTIIFGSIGEHSAALIITAIIALSFIIINIRGAAVTGKAENILTLSKIIVLAIFIFFGFVEIFDNQAPVSDSFTPFLPKGLGGVLVAMGLTFIAFEGYDLIATVAEEIKNPEKNIPLATFISLGVAVTIYLLILFVSLTAINPVDMSSWEFLGKFQETAIVRAAEAFMPAIGVGLIVFGGLLSTTSALNATVMAASRVAFSMGRDLLLPKSVAKIHHKRRTPHIAIILTGIVLLGMALTLPIEAVGSAASLIFLLIFSMVNLSVIALRRKYPEIPRKYKVPLYPVVPILGFSINIFLAVYQYDFQPIAWYITIGWLLLGLFLYYAIFERKASVFEPKVLLREIATVDLEKEPCVLIALHNPDNIETLIDIGLPIAQQRNLRLVCMSVVLVPTQVPIHEGLRFAHHKENLLNKTKQIAQKKGIDISTDLVIAHNPSDGIFASAEKQNANALVMGWKGFTNARDRIFGEIADKVIRHAPCDLFLYKIGNQNEITNCFLPTAGGPSAKLASSVIGAYAKQHNVSVTTGYIVPENADEEMKLQADGRMDETLALMDPTVKISKKIIESNSIAGGIAKTSKGFNLVVIGAAKEPFFKKILFGEIPEKVARYSPTSVLVVKKYEGVVKSTFKRVMG